MYDGQSDDRSSFIFLVGILEGDLIGFDDHGYMFGIKGKQEFEALDTHSRD